ncbi:MAG: efflux RND transporter periplasmic adaptor subunit [Hyphomicrobium sp.]
MNPHVKGLLTVTAVVGAACAGLWVGQSGLVRLPAPFGAITSDAASPEGFGPVIYYRDPGGKPLYSLTPKTNSAGQPYVAVLASTDTHFEPIEKPVVANADAKSGERKIKYYRNPMGLPDTSPTPKKDSMGMDYIPVYEGEESDDGSVTISLGKIQRTGVDTVAVSRRPIVRNIKVPGIVAIDERRIAVVAPRLDGFIENVASVTTGTLVKRDAPLVTVFSQELLNQAARFMIEQYPGQKSVTGAGENGAGLVGARRRLLNMGVPEEYITRIERDRLVPNEFVIRAPSNAVVLERNVVEGQAITSGQVLFRLADLSTVWILADVPEGDIGALQLNQEVKVTTRAHPGRVFKGKLLVIYPVLMKETRTARVRIELANADLALMPDMYADVEIATGSKDDVLAVPASAVIDSGARQVVLLDKGDGRFEPRDVKLGRKGDGFYEILSGVSENAEVVVDGNFLIDSESNLQAALKRFSAAPSNEVAP